VHNLSFVESCVSQLDCATTPNKDEQDLCPGCDDRREAPIGYFVSNDASVKKGVIHQWIVFFQKGGMVRTRRPHGK